MSVTTELLDQWKEARGITSDNQAAIKLSLGRATVSKWRNDESAEASDATIVRLARDLKVDPDTYLLRVATKRANTPELTALLLRVAKKLGVAACILFTMYTANCDARITNVYNATDYTFTHMSSACHLQKVTTTTSASA